MNAHAFMTELVAAYFGEQAQRPTLRPGQRVQMRFGGINCAPRLEPGVVIDRLPGDEPVERVVVKRDADGKVFAVHPSSLLVVVSEAS